jgi:hypothetical protein
MRPVEETFVCRISKTVLPIVLLLSGASHSQSLADVARQSREKKEKTATTAKKVYTTDDVSPSAAPDPGGPEKTPEMWTRQILGQKRWVAYLQRQTDRLNAAGYAGSDQAAGVEKQLAKEKEKLAAMQEAAFEAGMPNAVYNPKPPVRFSNANGARRALNMLNSQH